MWFFLNINFIAGSDYKSVIEVLQFEPGEVEKSVTVKSLEDRNIEGREYLELYLSSGQGVYLSPHPRAEIVIKDNDGTSVHRSHHNEYFHFLYVR